METLNFAELLSNYCFPIVCCIAMFVMWYRETKEHKAEAEKWAEAVNNNTKVMQQLLDRIKDDD